MSHYFLFQSFLDEPAEEVGFTVVGQLIDVSRGSRTPINPSVIDTSLSITDEPQTPNLICEPSTQPAFRYNRDDKLKRQSLPQKGELRQNEDGQFDIVTGLQPTSSLHSKNPKKSDIKQLRVPSSGHITLQDQPCYKEATPNLYINTNISSDALNQSECWVCFKKFMMTQNEFEEHVKDCCSRSIKLVEPAGRSSRDCVVCDRTFLLDKTRKSQEDYEKHVHGHFHEELDTKNDYVLP